VIANKGQDDGIAEGNVVVGAGGVLIGVVTEVARDHSTVRVIGDPALEVTARIVGTDVSGLIRVDTSAAVIMDFIQKSEQVTEGQSIVTSGNDQIPAGILIGTVRSVDSEGTTLFKTVRVSPGMHDTISGKVLILQP